MKENVHQTTQIIGGIVDGENLHHAELLRSSLEGQDLAFAKAVEQIAKVRDFVGSPEHILGSNQTKHGEIAEQVEVSVRNARDFLRQHPISATFEGVGRTAPEDYLIDGIKVQSKFINGINNNLDHVLEHMSKYKNFGNDNSYYHIPKDTYGTIQKILEKEPIEGLNNRTIHSIQQKVREIEEFVGKPFDEVVKPSLSKYSEVQQGKINESLDKHERELSDQNQQIKNNIRTEAQPNWGNVAHVAVQGAMIGGGIKLGFKIYEKHQQGKNLFRGDFTVEDWREIGLDTVKGATVGGITAAAIYALTNYAVLSAPLAGAFVSTSQALASLVKSLISREISFEEFVETSLLISTEAAAVTLSSIIGQTLIPIPILGAALGTIAGRIVMDFAKKYLDDETKRLQRPMDQYYNQCLAKIERTYYLVLSKIITEYEKLGSLTEAAFDTTKNVALRLQASIELAQIYGVAETNIIHNTDELDAFMLS